MVETAKKEPAPVDKKKLVTEAYATIEKAQKDQAALEVKITEARRVVAANLVSAKSVPFNELVKSFQSSVIKDAEARVEESKPKAKVKPKPVAAPASK